VVPQGFDYHETLEGDDGWIETLRYYWLSDQIALA